MQFSINHDHCRLACSGGETQAGEDCGELVTISLKDGGALAVNSMAPATAEAFAYAILEACKAARNYHK